jgi:hypothetical protein
MHSLGFNFDFPQIIISAWWRNNPQIMMGAKMIALKDIFSLS